MKLRIVMTLIFLAAVNSVGTANEPKADPRATALVAEASKNRYTWSPEVTAVAGNFVWKKDDKTVRGSFRYVLRKFHGLTVTADDAEARKEFQAHIRSHIEHRTPPPAGATPREPKPAVIVVEDETRGPLIWSVGDSLNSTFRVKDGKIVQVNRLQAGQRFSIDTAEYEKSADARYYPKAFRVTWWDAKTGIKQEKRAFTAHGFHSIDGQMFPKAETIVSEKNGKTSTVEIQYSDIRFEKDPPKADAK